jgi:hypothetical protein
MHSLPRTPHACTVCAQDGRQAFEASEETVCEYLENMHDTFHDLLHAEPSCLKRRDIVVLGQAAARWVTLSHVVVYTSRLRAHGHL